MKKYAYLSAILACLFGIYFAFIYRSYCEIGVLDTIKANPTITFSNHPNLFRLFSRAHRVGYVRDDDVIDNFVSSPPLDSIRNNGRSYFFYRLHDKEHEVGVSVCGDIETVSLLETMSITPKR